MERKVGEQRQRVENPKKRNNIMLFVYQDKFLKNGNCLAACISSILEDGGLLDSLPGLSEIPEGPYWLNTFNHALESRGVWLALLQDSPGKGVFSIAVGLHRGNAHACVYDGEDLVHNPYYFTPDVPLDSILFHIALLKSDSDSYEFHEKCEVVYG